MPDVFELTIPAEVDKLPEVLAFLEQHLEEAGCSMKAQMQLAIAAEEIFVNIAHYAYAPETGMATVRLKVSGEPKTAAVTFIDQGVPFDPLTRRDPTMPDRVEDIPIGGLGIMMTKRSVDDISYVRDGDHNLLAFTKRW